MPLRILTDEHVSPEVCHGLAALGYDVICARDRRLLGWKDWQLMPWCIARRYAICTKNGPDFEREHQRCRSRGQEHYGVLIVGDWTPEEIYWALRQYLETNPDPALLVNQVVQIPRASHDFVRDRSTGQE